MAKYGSVAIIAVELMFNGETAENAWRRAAELVFPTQMASREKGCPRGAFFGLLKAGLVSGASYTGRTSVNGDYALDAVRALRVDGSLAKRHGDLWRTTRGASKQPNQQMDVVVSLWQRGYLAA